MQILWSRGESSVREVARELERRLAYTTVMTTLTDYIRRGSFHDACWPASQAQGLVLSEGAGWDNYNRIPPSISPRVIPRAILFRERWLEEMFPVSHSRTIGPDLVSSIASNLPGFRFPPYLAGPSIRASQGQA